jgi:hypothetical protein
MSQSVDERRAARSRTVQVARVTLDDGWATSQSVDERRVARSREVQAVGVGPHRE